MLRKIRNVIKNPNILAVAVLNWMRFLPDKTYLKIRYRLEMGKKLNLKAPKSFNEKVNWLKVYNRNPEYKKLADKYEVREYIANAIGEEYLIPLLGVWDKWEDIDFDKLPNKFVLKCTHDSGSVVICKDKNTFDYEAAKKKITRKQKKNMYWWAREWVYKDLKPRIIAEQYMEDSRSEETVDYKFFCFNGEPKYLYISENLSNHSLAAISFYDMELNRAPFKRTDFKEIMNEPIFPKTIEKMKEFARILSKNHPLLRVDFYEFNEKIYFGELTFFTAAGYMPIEPEEWDYKLGEMIELPKE